MFATLYSWENLLLAFRKAAKGKRGHANVANFEFELEENLFQLQEELHNRLYKPGKYESFYIHEPKRRLISAAPFRDRVVHHALCNVTEPLFEPLFIADSYANRVGKGTHRALERAQFFARRYDYVVHGDLRQFFPSIDHAILHDTLAHSIKDARVLWLIDRILESGRNVHTETYEFINFPGDDLFSCLRPHGLPIGNLTSQFWANVYLNPFDQFVRRELGCKAYLRYVDDFLLFSNNKNNLHNCIDAIQSRMNRLRLSMHAGTQPRCVKDGIPFLGFVIYPEVRRLKRRKGVHFRRKLHHMMNTEPVDWGKIQASVQGWQNHVRYGNCVGLQKAVLGPANRKLEAEVSKDRQIHIENAS